MAENSKVIAVRVSSEENDLLEAMAKMFGMSKSTLVHEMLKVGFNLAKNPVQKLNEDGNI